MFLPSSQKDYILTCGGDIHTAADPNIGSAGILLPYRVHNEKELVVALKDRSHGFIVQGKAVTEILEADLP